MKNNRMKQWMAGSLLMGLTALLLAACQDVEFPEHSNKCEIAQIYMNVRVPQVDPAKVVYQAVYGTVDQASGTINFDVPYTLSTALDDVTDISAVYLVASAPVGSTIKPGLGGLRDMTQPLDIEVTAADGTKKAYTLKASLKKSSAKSIVSFEFAIAGNVFSGIPNEEKHEVSYMVSTPDLQELIAANKAVPTIEVSPWAKVISPDITKPIDFSQDVVVKVQAQDGSEQEWAIVQTEPQMLDYGFGYNRKKWQFSAEDMGFGNSLDYRGMTVTRNYVVVSARNFACLLFDKDTGAARGTAALPADLNDSNKAASMYVATDAQGKLAAGSFSSWTTGAKFVLYYWADGEDQAPRRVIEQGGLGDTGRKFAIVGDLAGRAFVYVTKGKGNVVYRFAIEGGVCTGYDTITITEPNAAFTYLCTPIPLGTEADSPFILVDQQASGLGCVSMYNADGKMTMAMTDGAKCSEGGVTADGKCFSFNNATYLMYIDLNGNVKGRIRIYDITKTDNFTMAATHPQFGSFLVFQSDVMVSTGNGNGTGAVAYDVETDGAKAYVYLMLTNGGIMKYELTKIAI